MMAGVIDRLESHGITYFRTTTETTLKVDRFKIDSSKLEEREFEGHKLRTLTKLRLEAKSVGARSLNAS